MITIILIILLLIVIGMTVLVGWSISLHYKRFGIVGDPNFKKLFNAFKTGSAIIICLALLFLILNLLL